MTAWHFFCEPEKNKTWLFCLEKFQRYEVVLETWNSIGRGGKTVPFTAKTLPDGNATRNAR